MGPELIRRVCGQIDETRLDEPSHEGRFSPREVVAHLADWEPIFLARIRQSVERPDSELEVFDEGEMALAHSYAQADIEQELRKYASHRRASVEYLRSLADADWQKSSRHPERGILTVREQAFTEIGHDMYHAEQLSGYFKPKDVASW